MNRLRGRARVTYPYSTLNSTGARKSCVAFTIYLFVLRNLSVIRNLECADPSGGSYRMESLECVSAARRVDAPDPYHLRRAQRRGIRWHIAPSVRKEPRSRRFRVAHAALLRSRLAGLPGRDASSSRRRGRVPGHIPRARSQGDDGCLRNRCRVAESGRVPCRSQGSTRTGGRNDTRSDLAAQ